MDNQIIPEQPSSAPTTPPPEDNTKCMVVHVDSLNELAAACDFGWLGLSDETVSLLNANTADEAGKKNVVVIVSIPARRAIVAYGIYLGNVTKRSEIKETQRRDLPSHWNNVARVGWVRVGEASWESVANSSANTSGLLQFFTSAADKYTASLKSISSSNEDSADHPSTWAEIPKGGDIVCASIDSASLQVLPHDLRDLHLNPQAAAELAERNNAAQAQRQQDMRIRQGGSFGHGTPGYQQRAPYGAIPSPASYASRAPQQQGYGGYHQQPSSAPQQYPASYGTQSQPQAYYGQQQQQQQQQQQAYAHYAQQTAHSSAPASTQQQTDPAQAAALAQYYQYMASLTPEQQQVAYQQYVAQYYQQQQQQAAEGGAPTS